MFEAQSQPPSYNASFPNNQTREDKYSNIIRKYEISNYFSQKLQVLQSFKIVFIFDDSGSMNTILQESPLNNKNSVFKATRWDELQYFANISIEIASVFNPQGCDVYFLNRFPALKNITSSDQLVNYFTDKPNGWTPLTSVLNSVLQNNPPSVLNERKLLIIIATDGEPTDSNGKVNIPELKNCLLQRPKNVYTTFVACTDDDDSVRYLNNWDRTMNNLDVVDDYQSEKKEVKAARGQNFSFTFGDYVVKSLIGSIDSEVDNLDEKNEAACCVCL